MEELSSILPRLIPAVLIVGYWILMIYRGMAKRRKLREERDRQPQAVPVEAYTSGISGGEEDDKDADEDEPRFSAWDLPVASEEGTPAAAPPPEKPAENPLAGIAQEGLRDAVGEIPVFLPVFVDEPENPPPNRDRELRQERKVRGLSPAPGKFPPLQNAVIWAEILGTPKGL
jgi:hypothetical protein